MRQHCQMSKVPLQVLSVSRPEGSTLTARYEIFLNAKGIGDFRVREGEAAGAIKSYIF
jgi:hypothetical protein